MTVEKLYYLVHSLTRDQKSNFTRYIRGGKKTLDVVLYERILSQKNFNEKASEIIRGKEFKVASKYYLYRIKLAEKIIQSLVSFESSKVSALSFIRRAVTMDAVELAEKALAEEMIKAQNNESYSTLRYLFDFAYDLEQDYNFKFSYHKDLKSREEVKYLDEVQHSLEDLLLQIRRSFVQNADSRKMAASMIASRLEEIEPETQKAEYTYTKVKVGISLLTKSMGKAQELQKGLVKQMLDAEIEFSITRMSKEISSLIRMSEDVGDKETALHSNFAFSQLSPKTLIEQKEFSKNRIIQAATVGESWANLSLAEKTLKDLTESRFQFGNSDLVRCFLRLGLNFFYNEKYSEALACLREVRSIPGKDWDRVTWEPDTLILLCHLEKGNHDVIDSLARAAYRNTRKYDLKYPKTVVKIIHQVIRSNGKVSDEIYHNGLKEIMDILNPGDEIHAGDEMHAAQYFDFSIWLHAKLQGTTQANLISQIGKLKFQRMGDKKFGT